MGKPFSVNTTRFDPYKTYRFLVYFGQSTTPVAGVNKVGGIKRTTDVIPFKEAGNAVILKGAGRTMYDPIILERGVTHDTDFESWANAVQVLSSGSPSSSLGSMRQDIRIELHNEAGQPVLRYIVHDAWVSEFQAMPDLDAGANAVAIEHLKLENHGWERDTSLPEPKET